MEYVRIDINKEMIEKGLKALDKNKASGPDEICWMLKVCSEGLSVPLKIIVVCENSISQAKLWECWK